MSEHIIKASSRNVDGKGASRRLRHQGKIPAIVYGGKSEPVNIEIEHEPLWVAQHHEWFYASILTLDIDGKKESVLLRDMQRHPYKQLVMHLDFQRVQANQPVKVAVPIHFIGLEDSPAGKSADVVVTKELNEVVVTCLPKDLPEALEIDLSDLKLGDVIHLSALKLPKGVEIPELALGDDHDAAIAVAKPARVESEPEAVEGEAAPAEAAADAAAEGDAGAAADGE